MAVADFSPHLRLEEDLPQSAAQPLRELVRYATLAANSNSTQPWQFRLSDRSILVLPDPRRRLPTVDPDDHHMFASLGCAVENIVQAARAFGLRAVPSYDPGARGIRVDLDAAPPERTDLFEAITHRQSTRVGDQSLFTTFGSWKPRGTATACECCCSQREAILSYLVAGISAQMDDVAFREELVSWIRFSYDDALSTRDGLFSKCSGNPVLPASLEQGDAQTIAEALADAYLEGAESSDDPCRLESLQALAERAIARLAWLRALT